MSNYRYLYLPVDLPIEDGCMLIDGTGSEFPYDPTRHFDLDMKNFRRAEPFIVENEFNVQKVVGKPSPDITWLKNGDEIARGTVEPWIRLDNREELPVIKIHCPTCKKLH